MTHSEGTHPKMNCRMMCQIVSWLGHTLDPREKLSIPRRDDHAVRHGDFGDSSWALVPGRASGLWQHLGREVSQALLLRPEVGGGWHDDMLKSKPKHTQTTVDSFCTLDHVDSCGMKRQNKSDADRPEWWYEPPGVFLYIWRTLGTGEIGDMYRAQKVSQMLQTWKSDRFCGSMQ